MCTVQKTCIYDVCATLPNRLLDTSPGGNVRTSFLAVGGGLGAARGGCPPEPQYGDCYSELCMKINNFERWPPFRGGVREAEPHGK